MTALTTTNHQLASGGGTPVLLSAFTDMVYDGTGNRLSVTSNLPATPNLSGVTQYTYDTKNQLLSEATNRLGGYTNSFSYDGAGNLHIYQGQVRSYNQGINQLLTGGMDYDAQGSPLSYFGLGLSYDGEGQLTSYDNAGIFAAGYDASGKRAWQEQQGQSIPRTYYVYDGDTPIVEVDGSGNVLAVNSFGANGLVSRYDASQSLSGFYRFDERGNVLDIGLGNPSVSTAGPNVYTAFGQLLSGASFVHGFGGQFGYQTDTATGLVLATHRYYDPNTGRWLTRDPIGYQGGINVYAYVGNNPITSIDPSGLDALFLYGDNASHGDETGLSSRQELNIGQNSIVKQPV